MTIDRRALRMGCDNTVAQLHAAQNAMLVRPSLDATHLLDETSTGIDSLARVQATRGHLASAKERAGHGTIPIHLARHFVSAAQGHGRFATALLARCGISPASAHLPQDRVPIAQFGRTLLGLSRRMGDEVLGLGSKAVPPGTFASAIDSMSQAPDLQAALRAGLRVYRGAIGDFRPRLRIDGELATVVLTGKPQSAHALFLECAFLYFLVGIASWLIQQRVGVREVRLHRRGGDAAPPSGKTCPFFGVPARFHEDPSMIAFDAAWLTHPVTIDVDQRRRFMSEAPACLLTPFRQRSSLSEQVRLRLRQHVGETLPSLEQTAWSLRMTPHALRRRLAQEGEHFQHIKNEVRRDLAIDMLVRTPVKLDEIALRLGFSESSTFHRSFKAWTGQAPGEYRKLHLNEPGR